MQQQNAQKPIEPTMALSENVIQFLIERTLGYQFDALIDYTVHTVPPEQKEELLHVDKFYIYRIIWCSTIEQLYKKYLPEENYQSDWLIEITPYTILLSTLMADDDYIEQQRQILKERIGNREDDFLQFNKEAFDRLGIEISAFSSQLNGRLPEKDSEKYLLLYRLMNFPPLQILARFYKKVYDKYTKGLETLIPIFASRNPEVTQLPVFNVLEPFQNSVIPFSHRILDQYGLSHFEALESFAPYKAEFAAIREKALTHEGTFTGTVVCSCCGTVHETAVPIPMLEYKFLLEHDSLTKDIAYYLLPELKKDYLETLRKGILDYLKNLNSVNNAFLVILVEGSSEEAGLPLLAMRKQVSLIESRVFIHNSGSKEKLYHDFLSFKSKHPKTMIICLLDQDAIKEKDDISRIIKDKKHKYDLIYLDQGTWEHIFPLDVSVCILNKMYPEGEAILVEDFEVGKDFNNNVSRILHQKKMASFNKVEFAERICSQIELDRLPQPINNLFKTMEKFIAAQKSMFRTSDKK